MPRLIARDLIVVAVLICLVVVVAVLALLGNVGWALVVLGSLTALTGVVSRLEFAARRQDPRAQRDEVRATRRVLDQFGRKVEQSGRKVEQLRRSVEHISALSVADAERATQLATDMAALRSEIRGMRVAQQLISQTITAVKTDVLASTQSIAKLERHTSAVYDSTGATAPRPKV